VKSRTHLKKACLPDNRAGVVTFRRSLVISSSRAVASDVTAPSFWSLWNLRGEKAIAPARESRRCVRKKDRNKNGDETGH